MKKEREIELVLVSPGLSINNTSTLAIPRRNLPRQIGGTNACCWYRKGPTELFLAILRAVNHSGDYRVISARESEGTVRAASITKKPVDNLVEFQVSYSDSGSSLTIGILDGSPQAYMECNLLISMFELYGPTYRRPVYITLGRFQHLISLHLSASTTR